MKRVERDGWVFDVDLDAQQHYYEEQEQCDCMYCVNYQEQIKEYYPELVSFLSELGVDVCRMDECSPLTCDDGTIDYFCVEYLVCGKIVDSVPYEIDIGPVSIVVHTDEMHLGSYAGDAYLLQIYGIKLPDQYGLVEEEHELEMKRRKKRHRINSAIAILLATLIIIPSICYLSYYAYWGRRHVILWNVDQVRVAVDEEDDKSVILIYDFAVKNWPHDFKEHNYYLGAWLTGEPCIWNFCVIGNNDIFSNTYEFSSKHQKQKGSFGVRFDLTSVEPWEEAETVRDVIDEAIKISSFRPYYIQGDEMGYLERGTLCMEDFPNIAITYEVDEAFLNQGIVEFLKD